jgi:hypothetical protein
MSIKEIPLGIAVVAMLMILFGLAEVVTGFTHDFFGISTSQAATFTYAAAVIGALYVVGGLLILTLKKWAARLARAYFTSCDWSLSNQFFQADYCHHSRHGNSSDICHLHWIEKQFFHVTPIGLTNRWSQPLVAVLSCFNFMKKFPMFAPLASTSGGSASSR